VSLQKRSPREANFCLINHCFILLVAVVALIWPAPAPAAEDFIGSVNKTQGTASIVRQGQAIPARAGERLMQNDTLRTGADGSLGVIFRDDTLLSLGPDSELTVDKFVFAPAEGNLAIVTKMAKGTAAYLSGKIAKLSPQAARFETPLAVLGIRGTRFVVQVVP